MRSLVLHGVLLLLIGLLINIAAAWGLVALTVDPLGTSPARQTM